MTQFGKIFRVAKHFEQQALRAAAARTAAPSVRARA
jgi:hypothetical protein